VNRGWKEEAQDRLLYRWLLLSCDRVVFVCRSQERHWLGKYGGLRGRSTVIYNGIDAQAYAPGGHAAGGTVLRARLGTPTNAGVFACVAGFRPEKGHDLLVRAFAALEG
jgi:glycosyltransferase involved in cell wall biosynthesis